MKLDSLYQDTNVRKHQYWAWLTNINAKQAEVLLAFAKDAFEQEARRGEQIDTKGNWLLAASFGALSLTAIVAKPAVDGLNHDLSLMIGIGVTIVIVCLLFAVSAVLWTIRVTRSWFPPNPELVLREEMITDNEIDMERDLALHYIDNFSLNRRVDDDKARLLKRGQMLLFCAIATAAFVGWCRLFA
jgi:hypothetical protein